MIPSDKYVRDPNNPGAVVNTDIDALKAYKAQKSKFRQVDNINQEMNDIKNEVADLKNMVSTIYQILTKNSEIKP